MSWGARCPQTRNRGTLGGNIANASPAGDTLPPLLTLDARVKLVSQGDERVIPLAEVLIGPGQTAIEPDEVLYSVSFSPMSESSGTAFLKLGNRKGMNIAVASVATAIHLTSDGEVDDVRIAFGSVAPTAVRSPQAESIIMGHPPGEELFEEAARAAMQDISPISDLRASAAYRRHAAAQLLRRALQSAVERGSVRA
jgi:CO/xanthine dehydrogenase FAD-binding subunit